MVFQNRMVQQQRRRRRPWLCGGGIDADEVAVPSTISKTLNKKKQNQSNNKLPAGAVDSRTGSSSTGCDESSSSGNDSRDQIDVNIPLWKAGKFLLLYAYFSRKQKASPIVVLKVNYFFACTTTENFLDAPLVEDDWWEDENEDDDDESSSSDSINEKQSGMCSDDDDDDESRVASYIMRLQQQYSNGNVANPPSSWDNNENSIEICDAGTSNNIEHISTPARATIDRKRFCNRGLQTWYLARQKWLTKSEHDDTVSMKTKKPASLCPIIPESFRKELKQCLIDRRQFELSQSIPLSCVVDTYQEVWQENGCD